MANYITEAFRKLDCLDEDLFDASKEGTEQLKDFIDDDIEGETVQIIDTEAEDSEDIEDSYIGKVILKCPVCHSMHYADKDSIEYDDESELVDISKPCPYCIIYDGGFEVIGEVAPYADVEVKVDDETVTDDGKEEEKEKEEVKVEESCGKKLKEAPIYGLNTQFDSRKSFGGKAQVDVQGDKETLYSYDTPVAIIEKGTVTLLPKWDLSATTLRHVKEFLKQHGFKADSRNQIAADYAQNMEESCGKAVKKSFKKVADKKVNEGYRGAKNVEYVSHGSTADPDLIYDGYTFNYWDIEDGLWDGFLDETGHKDSESNDPEVEKEFDKYVQDNVESYLDDVIAGGYFKKGSKSWHDSFNESCNHRKKVKEDKTSKLDRIDAKRDDRVEKARANLKKTIDDADAQRDDEKKMNEGGISSAEKYNRKADRIFSSKRDRDQKIMSYLRNNGYTEEKIDELRNNTGLSKDALGDELVKVGGAELYRGVIDGTITEDLGSWIASRKLKKLEKSGKAGLSDEEKKDFDLKRKEYQARAQRGAKKANPNTGDKANWTQRNLDKANELKKKGSADLGKETKKNNQIKRSREELFKKFGIKDIDELKKLLAGAGVSLSEALRMEDAKLTEAFEKVELETATEKIKVESEPKEEKTGDETIVPLKDETIKEIEANDETVEDSFADIDEIDEEDIDELGESYLKKVYENVNSFKSKNCKIENGKLIVEGVIGFKSGKEKNTSFVFESVNTTKTGKVKILGENKGISKCKNAFTFTGKVDNKKFIAESLTYKYNVKADKNDTAKRIYGRVTKKK